jgi:hypothetical protein
VESEMIFFSQANPPSEKRFSDTDIQSGAQKVVDHKLLLAEAKRFDVQDPTPKQVQEKLEETQKRFSTPREFEIALRQNAITLEDLKHKIAEHLIVDQFVDQRIRFFVFVLPEEIASYYTENQTDFHGKPLEVVEKDIEKTLLAQKEKAKLENYLAKLRSKASIQINF